MMPTKRSIKRAIEALKEDAASEPLEEAGDSEDEHLEIIPDVMCTGPAPTVSAFAQHRGFVVERGEANAAYTPLQTIPSMRAVYTPARWHMPGPTGSPRLSRRRIHQRTNRPRSPMNGCLSRAATAGRRSPRLTTSSKTWYCLVRRLRAGAILFWAPLPTGSVTISSRSTPNRSPTASAGANAGVDSTVPGDVERAIRVPPLRETERSARTDREGSMPQADAVPPGMVVMDAALITAAAVYVTPLFEQSSGPPLFEFSYTVMELRLKSK